jgi:hypothetical protein
MQPSGTAHTPSMQSWSARQHREPQALVFVVQPASMPASSVSCAVELVPHALAMKRQPSAQNSSK